jgi:hypothetical protein
MVSFSNIGGSNSPHVAMRNGEEGMASRYCEIGACLLTKHSKAVRF